MNVETVKGCAYRNDKSTLNQNVPFDHAALEKALRGASPKVAKKAGLHHRMSAKGGDAMADRSSRA